MAKKKPERKVGLLGQDERKIAPRLRVFANGSDEVNSVRAGFVAGIRQERGARLRGVRPTRELERMHVDQAPAAPPQKALPAHTEASVYVTRTMRERRAGSPGSGQLESARLMHAPRRRGNLIAATVRLADLPRIAADPEVVAIEFAEGLRAPTPRLGEAAPGPPSPGQRLIDAEGGAGVLIGIVDVQGFDFAHEDFLDARGRTRFVRIWDQGGSRRPPPAGFAYGQEIGERHLAAAIAQQSKPSGVPATSYEPQSQMEDRSHGTHVASIAAGNLGLCRNARIAAVLVDLGGSLSDRRASFYDSTRLADAVDYLIGVAEELGLPVSINVSLGTNGHAHDGSSAISRWIDSALTVPGRAVCVAAGNAGQDAPQSPSDLGYLFGRIHTAGRIAAKGLTADLEWLVIGSGVFDASENELEIWYGSSDRFGIAIQPPGMDWQEPVKPGEYIQNRQLPDGSFFSVYNELYHPANGANYIAVYLTPYYSESVIRGVKPGTWRVRLEGLEVRDGRFDGWIERDDPYRVGGRYWALPSVFSEASIVDRSTVSSLACGHNVIAVANLDHERDRISVSSSQGPTRDGRAKPEIAAPGTEIVAARGFGAPGEAWTAMSGTSMASPFVAGVVGLMLARKPSLTAAQILGILQRAASPLPGRDYAWKDDSGYGRIDPGACLEEADRFQERRHLP